MLPAGNVDLEASEVAVSVASWTSPRALGSTPSTAPQVAHRVRTPSMKTAADGPAAVANRTAMFPAVPLPTVTPANHDHPSVIPIAVASMEPSL